MSNCEQRNGMSYFERVICIMNCCDGGDYFCQANYLLLNTENVERKQRRLQQLHKKYLTAALNCHLMNRNERNIKYEFLNKWEQKKIIQRSFVFLWSQYWARNAETKEFIEKDNLAYILAVQDSQARMSQSSKFRFKTWSFEKLCLWGLSYKL